MPSVAVRAHRLVIAGLVAATGLAGAALGSGACSGPPPPAPSPVILATPTTVCLGDDYKTPITLDGTGSSPTLTLVPSPADANAPPLRYLWTLTGSAYRIADVDAGGGRMVPSGTLTSDKLVVRIAGDQPLQVDLNVENHSGGSADTTATISVTALVVDGGTPSDAGVCPLGNPG
jgi:hypothetical protein